MRASLPERLRRSGQSRYRYTRLRWRLLVGVADALGGLAVRAWRLVRPARRVDQPRRILLVQLDHLGDAVLSSVLFPRLKAAYPGSEIGVLTSPSNVEVFAVDPHVDRIHLADRSWFERRPGRWSLWPAIWELGRSLRAHRYDLGIDVRGDIASVLVLAIAGIPRRVGWAMGGGGFLLTEIAPWSRQRHEVRSRLALLRRLGIPVEPDDEVRVVAYPTDDDRLSVAGRLAEGWRPIAVPGDSAASASERARALAHPCLPEAPTLLKIRPVTDWTDEPTPEDDDRPLLVAHLGAGTAAKRWPKRHWHALIEQFLEDGWRVVLIGGPGDLDASAGLPIHPRLRDWTGMLRLAETAALLEQADLFVGADSGPAHLAACAGVPSVVLFSGTNHAEQWRPWSKRTLVLSQPTPCQPCHQKVCPLADHPCMAGLTPDRVHAAALRWLKRLRRDPSTGRRTHARELA